MRKSLIALGIVILLATSVVSIMTAQVSGWTRLTVGNNLISWTNIHQTIDGFGAAEAETCGDGCADNGTITAAQADFLWTTNPGSIGLSMIRVLVPGDLGD